MAQADMFGVCGRMTAQPGRRDEVVDLIREACALGVMRVDLLPTVLSRCSKSRTRFG
jgi:hypothetical protein